MTGTLDLSFEARRGRTVLACGHATAPLRVGSICTVDDAAYLILVSMGPGIFGGDALRQTIRVQRGARVVLASQSALQVHPSARGGAARVEQRYVVESGGELHCQWDPIIPFADAHLDQRVELDVAPDARLYWSDALMCGRAARDELWRFRAVAHELRVHIGSSLRYLERYCISPRDRPVVGRWIAGGARYLATTLVHDARIAPGHGESLQQALAGHERVQSGVDLVDPHLLASRLIGSSGVEFSNARRTVRAFAWSSIFGGPDPINRK